MGVFSENAIIGASAAGDYDIDQSARITGGKLIRTPTSDGNRKTWTYSAWVKRSTLDNGSTTQGDSQAIFSAGPNSSNYFYLAFSSSVASAGYQDSLYIDEYSGSQNIQKNTSQKFRDVGAWYHIVVAVDTTQATASNRIKVYVNGEQVTDWARDTNPPLNYDSQVNSTNFHGLGESSYGSGAGYWQYHGYLAEVHFIDGQALTPSDFAETNPITNQWIPKKYVGTYGTNGFYLPFSATELNNFVDSSSSSHTITANGDVTHSRVQKKIGSSSIYFDQTDALSCADNSDFDFGAGQFTVECWVRFQGSSLSSGTDIITKYDDSPTKNQRSWGIKYPAANNLEFRYSTNGSSWAAEMTFPWTPSLNTWYHVAVSRDGSGDIRAFIDGTQIGSTQNVTATFYNSTALLVMGADMYHGSIHYGNALDGYMDEIRISNTARYTSNFTPSTTAFSSDANTKLLIHSDFDGGLGADYSGNFNDFSATNLVATDQVLDSPTNNFCTINPIDRGSTLNGTFSEGNTRVVINNDLAVRGTIMYPKTGKWYAECLYKDDDKTTEWGFRDLNDSTKGFQIYTSGTISQLIIRKDNVSVVEPSYPGVNTIYSISYDADTGDVEAFVNGSSVYSGTLGTVGLDYIPHFLHGSSDPSFYSDIVVNYGQDSSFAGNKTAQNNTDGNGIGDFYYAPPSGYLALCTDNLPDPSIADPTDHFVANTYSGNGSSQTINTVFAPDLAWVKRRDTSGYHIWTDTVRGAGNYLVSNVNDAESSGGSQLINAFTSSGFTVGNENAVNNSSGTYVGWAWKAGGTASSNTDGTITSSVSANPTAGFSIVSYTGNSTAGATVGHGLSQAPEMLIVKQRDATKNWSVLADSDPTDYIMLNSANASGDDDRFWNDTNPSSSVFTLGSLDWVNNNTSTYIAYCFHSVDGYSKVGSYIGNGNVDGTFIYTGFRPAFLLLKRYDSTGNWILYDNKRNEYNPEDEALFPDLTDAETTQGNGMIDFNSNGFKMRNTGSVINPSSGTCIYLAFAESPFKYSNAR